MGDLNWSPIMPRKFRAYLNNDKHEVRKRLSLVSSVTTAQIALTYFFTSGLKCSTVHASPAIWVQRSTCGKQTVTNKDKLCSNKESVKNVFLKRL